MGWGEGEACRGLPWPTWPWPAVAAAVRAVPPPWARAAEQTRLPERVLVLGQPAKASVPTPISQGFQSRRAGNGASEKPGGGKAKEDCVVVPHTFHARYLHIHCRVQFLGEPHELGVGALPFQMRTARV